MNKKIEKYHFIGIGGIGMSALARILLDKKVPVSGSDLSSNANTQDLQKRGALVLTCHSAKHISYQDTVVYSSDIKEGNPEIQAAHAMKCKMLHRSELLAQLMAENKGITVSGTHGKTTTTSLLTAILIEAGLDPTFAIGGMFQDQINGKWGKGDYFVAEADESDGSFLNLNPYGAILTNIEAEHMGYYKTEEALHHAFLAFMERVKEKDLLFYCSDDATLASLARGKGISYGFDTQAQAKITHFKQSGWTIFFDLYFGKKIYENIEVALTGKHNALNAAACFAFALSLGVEEEKIRRALKNFLGVGRRCQKKKEENQILFLDDYAHHPTEISKTLEAVKFAIEERRLIVVFQPHRYTRTRDLLDDFAKAFDRADFVFITDIYSAGEEPIGDLSCHALLEKIKKASTVPCAYLPKEEYKSKIQNILRPHDVLITMGAGDITHLHKLEFNCRKWTLGLVFGGHSCEHEISLKSARYVLSSLDPALYDVRCFGIDKKGKWIVGEEAKDLLINHDVVTSPNCLPLLDPTIVKSIEECDLFLPILHGTYGEDGTIQGFFEMIGKPYVGPDLRAASISMDKILTKRVVEKAGVPTPKDLFFHFLDWQNDRETLVKNITTSLVFPLFVKPVHLGSSVGISCVEKIEDLEAAIDHAFRYDMKVMIEEGKTNCRELEFAVLGNTMGYRVDVPPPGEKLAGGNFVNYERKYSKNACPTNVSPEFEPDILKKGQLLAKKAYMAVGCSGMTRVDFLLDSQGNFWFFEMNPIPGLQKLSLFPKIWSREGLTPEGLVNRLIILALQRQRQQDRHFNPL